MPLYEREILRLVKITTARPPPSRPESSRSLSGFAKLTPNFDQLRACALIFPWYQLLGSLQKITKPACASVPVTSSSLLRTSTISWNATPAPAGDHRLMQQDVLPTTGR